MSLWYRVVCGRRRFRGLSHVVIVFFFHFFLSRRNDIIIARSRTRVRVYVLYCGRIIIVIGIVIKLCTSMCGSGAPQHRGCVGGRGGTRRGVVGGKAAAAAATRRVCALPTVRSVFFLFTSAGHDGLQTARSMHRLAAHDPTTTTWCSKVRRSHNITFA